MHGWLAFCTGNRLPVCLGPGQAAGDASQAGPAFPSEVASELLLLQQAGLS